MTYCTQCGKPLQQADANFCNSCGARLTPAPAYASPQPAYAPPAYAPPPSAPAAPLTTERANFRNTGMGFLLPAALLIIVLLTGMVNPLFLVDVNLGNILMQWAVYAAIAFAAVLPARANGPDLSIGSVIGLSAVIIGQVVQAGETWLSGLLLALLAAAIVGTVNGVINAVVRVRSILLTVLISAAVTGAVSFIVRRIALGLTDGYPVMTDIPGISPGLAAFILLLISFALAFCLNIGTRLGSPVYKTSRSIGLCIAAYAVSAVVAALAGIYFVIRVRAVIPTIGSGYEAFILFVFACVISSRALDNRFAPVLYALLPALSWAVLQNVLILNMIGLPYQIIAEWILAAAMLLIAFFSRYEKKPRGSGQSS